MKRKNSTTGRNNFSHLLKLGLATAAVSAAVVYSTKGNNNSGVESGKYSIVDTDKGRVFHRGSLYDYLIEHAESSGPFLGEVPSVLGNGRYCNYFSNANLNVAADELAFPKSLDLGDRSNVLAVFEYVTSKNEDVEKMIKAGRTPKVGLYVDLNGDNLVDFKIEQSLTGSASALKGPLEASIFSGNCDYYFNQVDRNFETVRRLSLPSDRDPSVVEDADFKNANLYQTIWDLNKR